MKNNHKNIIVSAFLTIIFFAFVIYDNLLYPIYARKYISYSQKRGEENLEKNDEQEFSEKIENVVPTETSKIEVGNQNLLEKPEAIEESIDIPQVGKVILADLKDMKIKLVDDGVILEEFSILAKGTEGSRYETPTGKYKVFRKEENHPLISRAIYMPYSLQFFGNFFIHGEPYYSNGEKLQGGDSGGCIRMSTPDSVKIFEFAELDTPIVIIEQGEKESLDEFQKSISSLTQVKDSPVLKAESFILADLKTGHVFLENNSSEVVSIFDLTNLMTAVVSDEINRDDNIVIANFNPDSQGVQEKIKIGDKFTTTQLTYAILFEKSFGAAQSIANRANSRTFIGLMNVKSKGLGMRDTRFFTPDGLEEQNISTARDLVTFLSFVYKKHPYFLRTLKRQDFSLEKNENHEKYTWTNNNLDLSDNKDLFTFTSEKLGLKSIMKIANILVNGEERPIATILLNSSDILNDTISSTEWMKNNYNKISERNVEKI